MASYQNSMSGLLDDYTQLNTIPALLSVLFVVAGLYQFGGISDVTLTWLDYTLTTQHATFASIGTYAVAFASSETKEFKMYEDWEQVMIAAGPLLIVGYQYIPQVADIVNTTGSNLGPIVAFLVTVAAWGVAVR